jgi:hypothetical protein
VSLLRAFFAGLKNVGDRPALIRLEVYNTGDNTLFVDAFRLIHLSPETGTTDFVNGDFEQTYRGPGTISYLRGLNDGWIFGDGGVGIIGNDSPFDNGAPYSGVHCTFIQVAGSNISQLLTLPVGAYQIQFLNKPRPNNYQGVIVSVNGVEIARCERTPPASEEWQLFTTPPFILR